MQLLTPKNVYTLHDRLDVMLGPMDSTNAMLVIVALDDQDGKYMAV